MLFRQVFAVYSNCTLTGDAKLYIYIYMPKHIGVVKYYTVVYVTRAILCFNTLIIWSDISMIRHEQKQLTVFASSRHVP